MLFSRTSVDSSRPPHSTPDPPTTPDRPPSELRPAYEDRSPHASAGPPRSCRAGPPHQAGEGEGGVFLENLL